MRQLHIYIVLVLVNHASQLLLVDWHLVLLELVEELLEQVLEVAYRGHLGSLLTVI